MENRIHTWIGQAEKTWLEILHRHVESHFSETFLPSHDHTHHRRVWNICKIILEEVAASHPELDPGLVEGVLIAAYFHDLGMVRSTREDHGVLGREMCASFFSDHAHSEPSRFTEVLEAIELHDLKGDQSHAGLARDTPPGILQILSWADDMEAMGVLGIYRYTEIYLKRGISLRNLGVRVLGNAYARYITLWGSRNISQAWMDYCHSEYQILTSFFDNYNQQLLVDKEIEEVYHGHLGVVNHIRNLSVNGKTHPQMFLRQTEMDRPGSFVKDYFTALDHEIQNARLQMA